jgi:lactoylglutathione lyase
LIIAQESRHTVEWLRDPDNHAVRLVPRGYQGIRQTGIRLSVRDLALHHHFYADVLELTRDAEAPGVAFGAGETLMFVEEEPTADQDAAGGAGWRYITSKVFKVDATHAQVIKSGGQELKSPVTLGTTARISMIADPDGTPIELSQRASIVGTLEGPA